MNGQPIAGFNGINGRIPGKEILPSGAPRRFLTFSAFIFFLTILIYVGLSYGYKAFLNSEIEDIQTSIEDLRFEVPLEEQEELVVFFSQIGNIQGILDNHIITTNLFPALEKYTHSEVAYRSMEISTLENKVSLDGIAGSYEALVSQLAIYESAPEIERVILNNSQRSANAITFRVTLTMDEELFDFKEAAFAPAPQPVDETETTE